MRTPAVRVFNRQRRAVPSALLRRAARAAGPLEGPVEITVVDDRAIRAVNRDFLGHDRATDVCTFPAGEPGLWGEILISAETAAREARRRGLPTARELALYAVHGVLHLRGLDDRTAAQRRAMRAAESMALEAVFGTLRSRKKGGLRGRPS
ncbi:MAG: rRNA maturation RNase YbeY [Planctomycetes bacterium]|nr:rRNA maturation RNase YbeY [Planctomycetota bacterium]